ncbi:hypothetical protein [Mycolicibacterium fortuitum]|uniref:Uncharacterized protein n=2 Tax=Mycolicibacterium fortuitum TaxID=1766 RepID=A0A378UZ27_MYCFO|nr:hypothetical protein [Mycolicibacterium fortuitum]AIY49030.1 hypothetical protein G155_29970 [Mycobacterium sp. VKM Ac-1817D]AMD56250.1 hypothetical protein ATO49_28675 [Mycolicibacterium fortuitum subsp. fortuitum DSM 46621 = ATCC 6841 = JCM 6387]EJZ13945.1 hypothetical protein MFORT_12286 [Mycolicibacterium fortuitum subsp. fortuitum DSM 46621 = ATCC 6841 = JCM 6387]OBG53365.1 hypothetical protein A5670_19440 [Mycolicibacterium fortuitum]WEV32824.1 hypothetical protein OMF10_30365 [Mycoli
MTSPPGSEGQQPASAPGETQLEEPTAAPGSSTSGTTAIITAVLAGIGALLTLGNGIAGLSGLVALFGDAGLRTLALRTPGPLALTVLATLLSVACGLLLLAGTVALLRGRMIGRRLIVGGCGLIILGSLISLGLNLATTARSGSYGISGLAILSLVLPVATLVLALLPSTTNWLLAKQDPVTAI